MILALPTASPGNHFCFLATRAALQVRHPVCEEVVGLRLVGVAADGHDDVGQLGILVAVVELADAHLARRMALGVVRRAVVDAHHRRLERREHQLAGAPRVLEAAAGAAVVEAVEDESARTVGVENLLGDAGSRAPARRPSSCRTTGRPCTRADCAGAPCRRRRRVYMHRRQLAAARRRQPLVHRATACPGRS